MRLASPARQTREKKILSLDKEPAPAAKLSAAASLCLHCFSLRRRRRYLLSPESPEGLFLPMVRTLPLSRAQSITRSNIACTLGSPNVDLLVEQYIGWERETLSFSSFYHLVCLANIYTPQSRLSESSRLASAGLCPHKMGPRTCRENKTASTPTSYGLQLHKAKILVLNTHARLASWVSKAKPARYIGNYASWFLESNVPKLLSVSFR